MPRKFTYEQRKRILERLQNGATIAEIKSEFKIRDSRTLEKQLTQSRQEEQLRTAKTELIKENLSSHLAEIRSLLETWVTSIRAPTPPSFDRHPLSAAEQTEQTRLFDGIRGHLPFPKLWRDYQAFKMKWYEYLSKNEELHQQVVENASEKWKLNLLEKNERSHGLTPLFSWETLDHAIKVATEYFQAGTPKYSAGPLDAKSPRLEFLMCDGQVILYSHEADRFVEDHRSMIEELARSEAVKYLVKLVAELRELEAKIHGTVEEILLRRDYILYSCRLCPGGGRLA